MAYDVFSRRMTALADAVRAKFGLTGALTVADMVTAVSGLAYTSAGNTLAGFNADMSALGDAIRTRLGISGPLTVTGMTEAIEAAVLGYTSFADEALCTSEYCGDYNRIGIVLPSGEYTGMKIYGISSQPYRINFGANVSGGGGTAPVFSYESGTVAVEGTVPGGRLCLTFSDSYDGLLGVSPQGNGSSGFSWSEEVTAAASSQTSAFASVFLSGYCLMMTFDSFTPSLTLTSASDDVTPEIETEYRRLLDEMSVSGGDVYE